MSGRLVRAALGLSCGLAAAGVAVAGYLTWTHFAHQPIACNGLGDCEYVNSSEYAELAGVPVAVLGLAAYALMLAGVVGAAVRRSGTLLIATWGIGLASFAFSMYLTYIELRVLYAICVYCVVSASIMTALFATLSAAVWRARDELFEEESGSSLTGAEA